MINAINNPFIFNNNNRLGLSNNFNESPADLSLLNNNVSKNQTLLALNETETATEPGDLEPGHYSYSTDTMPRTITVGPDTTITIDTLVDENTNTRGIVVEATPIPNDLLNDKQVHEPTGNNTNTFWFNTTLEGINLYTPEHTSSGFIPPNSDQQADFIPNFSYSNTGFSSNTNNTHGFGEFNFPGFLSF